MAQFPPNYLTSCLILAIGAITLVAGQNEFEQNIFFRGETPTGVKFRATIADMSQVLRRCPLSGNFSVIIHGWTESYTSHWVPDIITAFKKHRRGCVFFMDHSFYSTRRGYPFMLANLGNISGVLTRFLQRMEELRYSPNRGWVFGMSYGSPVAFEGAYKYGPRKLARVDACDPAGPGFNSNSVAVQHASSSAKVVQCIHTSDDLGTSLRYCQWDMSMGECGRSQASAGDPPRGSHGMCPIFYALAFEVDFTAQPKPSQCTAQRFSPDVSTLGYPVLMGPRLNTRSPQGEYFVPTTATYPYN